MRHFYGLISWIYLISRIIRQVLLKIWHNNILRFLFAVKVNIWVIWYKNMAEVLRICYNSLKPKGLIEVLPKFHSKRILPFIVLCFVCLLKNDSNFIPSYDWTSFNKLKCSWFWSYSMSCSLPCLMTDCLVLFLWHSDCKSWLYPQVLTVSLRRWVSERSCVKCTQTDGEWVNKWACV